MKNLSLLLSLYKVYFYYADCYKMKKKKKKHVMYKYSLLKFKTFFYYVQNYNILSIMLFKGNYTEFFITVKFS